MNLERRATLIVACIVAVGAAFTGSYPVLASHGKDGDSISEVPNLFPDDVPYGTIRDHADSMDAKDWEYPLPQSNTIAGIPRSPTGSMVVHVNCYFNDQGFDNFPVSIALEGNGQVEWELPSPNHGVAWRPLCGHSGAFDQQSNFYMIVYRETPQGTNTYQLASVNNAGVIRWLVDIERAGHVWIAPNGRIWVQEWQDTGDRKVSIRRSSDGKEVGSWAWDREVWLTLPFERGAAGIGFDGVSYRFLTKEEQFVEIPNLTPGIVTTVVHFGVSYGRPDGTLFLYRKIAEGPDRYTITKVTPGGVEWESPTVFEDTDGLDAAVEMAATSDGGVAVAIWDGTSQKDVDGRAVIEASVTKISPDGTQATKTPIASGPFSWTSGPVILADDRNNVVVNARNFGDGFHGNRITVLDGENEVLQVQDIRGETDRFFSLFRLRPGKVIGLLDEVGVGSSVSAVSMPAAGRGLVDTPLGEDVTDYSIIVNHRRANGKIVGVLDDNSERPELTVTNQKAIWFDVSDSRGRGGVQVYPDSEDLYAVAGVLPPDSTVNYTVGDFSEPDEWARLTFDPGTSKGILFNVGFAFLNAIDLHPGTFVPDVKCGVDVANVLKNSSFKKFERKLRHNKFMGAARAAYEMIRDGKARSKLARMFKNCWGLALTISEIKGKLKSIVKGVLTLKKMRGLLRQLWDTISGAFQGPVGSLTIVSCGPQSQIRACRE